MALMPITDSMFLLVESREHPMHVGGLQLFRKPDGAGDDFLRGLREDLLKTDNMPPLFRRRPARPVNTAGYLAWAQDPDVDLDYHFRHSALPQPGRVRELLELTSRWHSTLLDRHRPLWEIHLVEGLRDGRFAMYSKIHHALMDGVSALRHLQGTLSDDPDDHECPPPWGSRRPPREKQPRGSRSLLDTARNSLEQLAGLAPAAVKVANEAFRENTLMLPMQAPRTMLNVPIGGARRFAAQSWPLSRVRSIAAKTGTSRNDIVLAMCAGALRDYLIEQSALPDAPLVAMVPLSMRKHAETESGGNQIGAMLCNLATDKTDAAVRLATIHHSMREAKRIFKELTPVQALLLSGINVAQLGISTVPGVVSNTRPPFNLVISNVPGPRKQMYWNGAHLDGIYPASVLLDGQALNITLTNTGDNLDFGITGCRRSVPHLQRLLVHLDTALTELEAAVA
ncbi:wax ester/triacylglycerol synthase family O-acyltransferase [Amycolatopsis acidiphila]|uniref:Diacylglycerol O-acyltransferase n=1 Tax=Amycolatopsis acidiphila TaxID=715473 RepID=A0A558AE60_9PSEU|nr:wax ester/triacylglycerol synthase family O-acyltransferase [Amycolatopsis acidiphila]TVT22542.1 wax ester/triacylglycerol synthase family O-acyltransferase [Amycolatopsis acidiphila]UIJ58822.1 wax ester/triacylglycerol synthase family O-acyltransferase [Amycolatopsis acidiphila]GHG72190.1 diacylglycerol O-acyltransferase [Amycolatopsis acidiphila]